MKPVVTIRKGLPTEPGATRLLEASHALMESLFPAESNHYLPIDALLADHILFRVAEVNEEIAGCAALAIKDGYGEVKSMFVDPGHRGHKIGQLLLAELESEAKAHKLPWLYLETGNLLHAAHKLYENVGFTRRDPFGDYPDDPNSVFMEKRI